MPESEASAGRRYHYPAQPPRPKRYVLVYKPYDVLSEFGDVPGKTTLGAYVPILGLEPAGRLDQDSEGLLLLTDDGALAHQLTHPNFHVPKTYLVQVEGVPDKRGLDSLREGVLVKGETSSPAEVDLLERTPELPRGNPRCARISRPAGCGSCCVKGRSARIRHMTAAVGHPTLRLVRVAIGPGDHARAGAGRMAGGRGRGARQAPAGAQVRDRIGAEIAKGQAEIGARHCGHRKVCLRCPQCLAPAKRGVPQRMPDGRIHHCTSWAA